MSGAAPPNSPDEPYFALAERGERETAQYCIQNKAVLTMEDVGVAVREYGIGVKRGDF